ncbi:MAG: Lactyl (2) diphospho-(5')guanosine:7,8-didemethyl-8-hydroxy-5-deazariboflavin 2-phospho-L-lactate transferase [Anaerolineae bacterium]|nr:MAG: Lactyl (2) diphospho-(5')guanosine:7,8-didemethyl-8-hydroxy-5-deazariboflavin 2-phospho-L-lactate transferase [Anaerolineae bacterium]
MKVVAFAGGVGGAKLADGLARCLSPQELTIVVNTGDDFVHFGLKICPDLDTVCYTLAGLANPETGWGRAGETWNTLRALEVLEAPTWFQLGDLDLATHLERTRRLREGETLSEVTRFFCQRWGVAPRLLPMSDDAVQTIVETDQGDLSFQEYFVKYRFEPSVRGFRFEGAAQAVPAPGVLEAISACDVVIFCPSNPWVSIDPILAVAGVRQAILQAKVVAVSPIVGGKALKGPAAKMFAEIGIPPSAQAVALHYGSLLKGFVFDRLDAEEEAEIRSLGLRTLVTDTVMKTIPDRQRLAQEILTFVQTEFLA